MNIVISYDSNNQLSIKRRRIEGPDDHSNHANQSRSIMLEMDDQDFCRLVQSSDVILIQVNLLVHRTIYNFFLNINRLSKNSVSVSPVTIDYCRPCLNCLIE